ncbi:hypothetical protein PV328_010853 [Microctonus aethiopoides]|uniref:Cuticle protein n=1 Tax=Microctonus aethiopoides TaxID=144406 RepID=A0AA39KQQ5_9HYME|nr:hypothetical protein PV328_010853 [Microctonus aethiopoides]
MYSAAFSLVLCFNLEHKSTNNNKKMAFKFIMFAAFLAMARAGDLFAAAPVAPLAYAAPAVAKLATPVLAKHIEEPYDSNPQYSYGYDVQDSLTGDNKQQHESRNGDLVQGSYSFIEADGSRRIVEYTADPLNGFNAVVRKEPGTVAAAAAPVIAKAPVAIATPAHLVAKAPLAYAPPAPVYASAPLAYSHPSPAFAYAAQPVAKLATAVYH